MSKQTATERLRELLDERGMTWGNVRRDGSVSRRYTEWRIDDNRGLAMASEWSVGGGLSVEVCRHDLTPEQAIGVTLGRGTCHIERRENAWGGFTEHCGVCGADLGCDTRNTQHFCPNCGVELIR